MTQRRTALSVWTSAILLAALTPASALADTFPAPNAQNSDHLVPLTFPDDPRVARYPLLDVRVNNKPARMLLDTGASSNLLSDRIAEPLGLGAVGLSGMSDHFATGTKENMLKGAVITAGDWTLSNGEALLSTRLGPNFGYDGLLSPQLLASSTEAMVLDLVHGKLATMPWYQAEALWGGLGANLAGNFRVCQMDTRGPAMGFVIQAEIAGEKVELLLDSGADHSDLSLESKLGQRLKPQAKPAGFAHSVSQTREIFTLPDTRLAIGAYRPTVNLLLVPGREMFECRHDGVLGIDVLRQCVIAISGRKLLVQCQPPAPTETVAAAHPGTGFIGNPPAGTQQTEAPAAGPPGLGGKSPMGKPWVTLASAQKDPRGIAVDAHFVYWTNTAGGQVLKVSHSGGTPVVLASGLHQPYGIAVDATSVYWTSNLDKGEVRQLPLAGGQSQLLASGRRLPQQIVVDADAVYWTEGGARGRVMKQQRGDGSPIVLASNQDHPCRLTLDGSSLYWRNQFDDAVMIIALSGGSPRALGPKDAYPTALADFLPLRLATGMRTRAPMVRTKMLAMDATSLYWTDARAGTVLKLAAVLDAPTTSAAQDRSGGGP